MMQKKVFNFLLFQTAWFITIISAASGHPLVGVLFTALWMIVHFRFFTARRFVELNTLCFAALLGYLLDSFLVYLNVISFPSQSVLGSPSTLWMIALWVNLAATLNFSLYWLQRSLISAAVMAAIAGPATYYAGSRFGAIEFGQDWSLLAISVQWLLAMPLLFWFTQRQTMLSRGKVFIKQTGEN
jgi:hypothetical protein